jgi:hypothetical protein
MNAFQNYFDQVPVSRTLVAHWAAQDQAVLNAAAAVLDAHGANPWVFAADARHFWQFASVADAAALYALTADQTAALLDWGDDDWDPAAFGYQHP